MAPRLHTIRQEPHSRQLAQEKVSSFPVEILKHPAGHIATQFRASHSLHALLFSAIWGISSTLNLFPINTSSIFNIDKP